MVEERQLTFKEFLESVPPLSERKVMQLAKRENPPGFSGELDWTLQTPKLTLHCDSDTCGGERTFYTITSNEDRQPVATFGSFFLLRYKCKNCDQTEKVFSVKVERFRAANEPSYLEKQQTSRDDWSLTETEKKDGVGGKAVKIGELPSFGPRIPNRVLNVIGEKELFLKGRQIENQGLGIGAFAYYRRIVEDQWSRLVGKIIDIAKNEGAPRETIEKLEEVQKDWRFKRSVGDLKDAIPDRLRIQTHNPLMLLHSALSDGCMVIRMRNVLTWLATSAVCW